MADVKIKVKTEEEGTKEAANNWTELASKWGLAKEAAGLVAGAVKAVYDTMKEGAVIKAAATNFDTLTASMGGSQAILEGLRNATSGMVDDMTLMSSANSLMTMGIDGTSDELSKP